MNTGARNSDDIAGSLLSLLCSVLFFLFLPPFPVSGCLRLTNLCLISLPRAHTERLRERRRAFARPPHPAATAAFETDGDAAQAATDGEHRDVAAERARVQESVRRAREEAMAKARAAGVRIPDDVRM